MNPAVDLHDGLGLILDPIYGYLRFTTPRSVATKERTEEDLIDSPWCQRLRRIRQIQSAFWVFPSAEHSRFQHSLGTMHLAGRFARHLYPSLSKSFKMVPSLPYIEETLRVAGLLHDIGHGPFSHFFDSNWSDGFGINHEIITQSIVTSRLARTIRGLRRSPSGPFNKGEVLQPDHIAYLIRRHTQSEGDGKPFWLRALAPLFSGIYTADNLDYVLRDSYMTGVSTDPVDIDRLLYYSFFTKKGLTLHRQGISALIQFLNARLHLYSNVYYHRTTRAIDLHLKEIFRDTMRKLAPRNPMKDLDGFMRLTEWSLLEDVEKWSLGAGDDEEVQLGKKWVPILMRKARWKAVFEFTFSLADYDNERIFALLHDEEGLTRRLRASLPRGLQGVKFRVDLANQDPRPLNPLAMGESQIHIFDPSTGRIEKEVLREMFKFIPARVIQCRIYALNHKHHRAFADAFESVFMLRRDTLLDTNL